MISGVRTSTGALTFSTEADANAVFMGGILINPDGSICATEDNPTRFVGGFGVLDTGFLCIAPDGVIANYQFGLPFTSAGQLVTTEEVTPVAGDSWANAIRVGSGLGVYGTGWGPPVDGLLALDRYYDPTSKLITDKVGANERTLYPLQYQVFAQNDYLSHASLTATCTFTHPNGTGVFNLTTAGRLTCATAGTLWTFSITYDDAVVSTYEFSSRTSATTGTVFDTSGNGRHLTCNVADLTAHCASGMSFGSDTLNRYGVGMHSYGTPIPSRTDNRALAADGSAITYPGRAKYSEVPKASPCATFASGTSIAVSSADGGYSITGGTYLNAGTATVTIGTNSIAYATAGTVFNLRITTATGGHTITFPCSAGAGTTLFGYDELGHTYTGVITTSDLTAFWTANTQDTYHPSIEYGCNKGRWSPVDNAYKDEPTRTNKCTCVKANPVDTTNLSKGGDAASILSVVDDTAALTAAGLIGVCTSGKVYKFDNSAGSIVADAVVTGPSANTNLHSYTCRIRGGSGNISLTGWGVVNFTSSASYVAVTGTVSQSGVELRIRVNAGQIVYFILPQLEEGAYSTSPIIGTDTAAAQTEYNRITPANPYNPGKDVLNRTLANPPLLPNASCKWAMPASAYEVASALGIPSAHYNSSAVPISLTYAEWSAYGDADGLGPELVVNGDFELGTTNMTAGRCTLASITGGVAGNCCEMTYASGSSCYIETSLFNTTIGKTYAISVYIKSGTSGSDSIGIYAINTSWGSDGDTYTMSSEAWAKISVTFVATTSQYRLWIQKNSSTAGTILADKLSCKEVITDKQVFYNSAKPAKGTSIYSTVQVDPALTKIKKYHGFLP